MENNQNVMIITWKIAFKGVIDAKKLLLYLAQTEYDPTNDIREYASKQLKLLDEAKPNKEKSLYSQCNEMQKAFIDYLELVILHGNLEGKDYTK